MKKYYEIRFDTKKGLYKSWVIHIEANTANEAKEICSDMWNRDKRLCDMHRFHVTVRCLKETEEFKYHYFSVCGR